MRYIIFYYYVILKQISTTSAQLRFRPIKAIRSFQTSNDFRNDQFQGERQRVYNTTRSPWFQSVRPAASANPMIRVQNPATVQYSPSPPVLTQRFEYIQPPDAPVLRSRPIGMPTSIFPNYGNGPSMPILYPTSTGIQNIQGKKNPILHKLPEVMRASVPQNYRNAQSQTKLFRTVAQYTMATRLTPIQTAPTPRFRNKQVLRSQMMPMLRNTLAQAMPADILQSQIELSRAFQTETTSYFSEQTMRTGVLLKREFTGEQTERELLPPSENVEVVEREISSESSSSEDYRTTILYKRTKRRIFKVSVSTRPPYPDGIIPEIPEISGDYFIDCDIKAKCHKHVWRYKERKDIMRSY